MIGVVLWSDNSAGKAVFWCEDQGDLAYYEEPPVQVGAGSGFDTGDMVQFDISVHRRLRIADNPRLVQEKAGTHLSEALRDSHAAQTLQEAPTPKGTAQIISFAAKAEPRCFHAAQLKA